MEGRHCQMVSEARRMFVAGTFVTIIPPGASSDPCISRRTTYLDAEEIP